MNVIEDDGTILRMEDVNYKYLKLITLYPI